MSEPAAADLGTADRDRPSRSRRGGGRTRTVSNRAHSHKQHSTAAWTKVSAPPSLSGVIGGFALLLAAGVATPLVEMAPIGKTFLGLSWASLYLAVVAILMWRFGSAWARWLVLRMPLLILVVAVAVASVFWSHDRPLAAGRAFHLLGATLVGVVIGYSLQPRPMMRVFFWTFVILMISIPVSILAFPGVAFQESFRGTGGVVMQGLLGNKNGLGSMASIAIALFLIGTLGGRIEPISGTILVGLSCFALFLAQSATAYVVAAMGVCVVTCFILSYKLRLGPDIAFLIVVAGTFLSAIFLFVYIDSFTQALGRNSTLTNRTMVWSDALRIISERPWLGYGFGMVWGFGDLTRLPHMASTGWAGHAHNGFLNLATQIGLLAAITAVLQVCVSLWNSARAMIKRASPFTLFGVTYMFMFVVMNLAESSLYAYKRPEWIIFVAVAVATLRMREGRVRRHRHRSVEAVDSPTVVRAEDPL